MRTASVSEIDCGTPFFGVSFSTSGAGVPYAGYGIGVPLIVGSGAVTASPRRERPSICPGRYALGKPDAGHKAAKPECGDQHSRAKASLLHAQCTAPGFELRGRGPLATATALPSFKASGRVVMTIVPGRNLRADDLGKRIGLDADLDRHGLRLAVGDDVHDAAPGWSLGDGAARDDDCVGRPSASSLVTVTSMPPRST